MKSNTAIALVCMSFYAAIGVACWATSSGLPLFALFLGPELRMRD